MPEDEPEARDADEAELLRSQRGGGRWLLVMFLVGMLAAALLYGAAHLAGERDAPVETR